MSRLMVRGVGSKCAASFAAVVTRPLDSPLCSPMNRWLAAGPPRADRGRAEPKSVLRLAWDSDGREGRLNGNRGDAEFSGV